MANLQLAGHSTRFRTVGLTALGIGALLVTGACSSNSGSGSTTPTATPTTAEPTMTVTATATSEALTGIPAPPPGSTKLSGGDTYSRYKNSSKTPINVVDFYKSELGKKGYSIVKVTSGGGGYGPYGGSGAGLRAKKGNSWAGVGAGAEKSAPTYFSVCVSSSESGINRCDGSNDQDENHSNSGSS